MSFTDVSWDIVERAGWTGGQQFISVLLTSGASRALQLPWQLALSVAAAAAVGSVVLTVLQDLVQWVSRRSATDPRIDLGIRLAKTFLSSLLGTMTAGKVFNAFDFDWPSAFNLAAVATITALAKGLFARQSPGHAPSTLPDDIYQRALSTLQSRTSAGHPA